MKPLHDIPKGSNLSFATYHPHYKEKIVSNPTRTFICAADCLYLYGLSNLSAASFLAHDGGACTAEPSLVTKKREPPRTLIYFSNPLKPPSLLFSLTLLKMRPAMFKYLAMFKCAPISKWPSENLPEASFDPSLTTQTTAQTVKFSPDNIALLNKRLQQQTTNKFRQLCHVKLDPRDTHMSQCKQVKRDVLATELYAMAHMLNSKKRH